MTASRSIRWGGTGARSRAFTVMEMMVAVGITALLVTLLLVVLNNSLRVWNHATGRLTAENEARLALDYLARDLQGAVMRADGRVWLVATVQPPQTERTGDSGANFANWVDGVPKPAGEESVRLDLGEDFADWRFGQAGMWLRLITMTTESAAEPSMPRAVAYQIIRRPVADGFAYQLYRSAVGAEETFRAGYDLLAAAYNEGVGTARVAGNVRRPNTDFLLANHVVDFGVRFPANEGEDTWLFPRAAHHRGFAATSDRSRVPRHPAIGAPGPGEMTYGFPRVAEVMVRVLSSEGVRLVGALEGGHLAGDWWEIVERHSRVYTRRIVLLAEAL